MVDPRKRFLFLVLGQGKATRYGVAVGKAGRTWSGDAVVGKRQAHDLQLIELPTEELPGELTLELHYSGKADADRDQEGLFRQQGFVFTQAEAAFARRIVPCFDEPGFKASWQVTVVAPKGEVALANAPMESDTILPDGRHETRFAPIDALPE